MIFKVDFAIAFDSLSWNYLFIVMNFMGFSKKLSYLIRALNNVRSSALVNGSPTDEFSIKHGLCQGDPFLCFCLFLLWKVYMWLWRMWSLLVFLVSLILETKNFLSHLFYVDDAIINGD